MHGGNSRRGPDHPRWKTGLYSTTVPSRYVETAVRALDHPDSLSTRQQIALMDARAAELFEQMSIGGHGEMYQTALKIVEQLDLVLENPVAARAQFDQLRAVLEAGVRDHAVWKDLLDLWDDRRRAIDTDSKVQFRQRVAMSQEQSAALAAIVIQAAFEVIPDEADRQRFADRIEANSPGGVRALTRGTAHRRILQQE